MRILSLFDGMACGYLAMQRAGVPVEAYHAYEIDKYAVKTAQHNFPDILEHGDVFTADFTVYRGLVDFLVGGSPCTYWSIAQTKNRETEASGLGWELFSQYVRALHEAKPRYFIYENNKSMAKAIRDQIRATFGFEEICINSALVSAQNRQRLYWVGKRNEDGTYSKVDVQQPEDLGILLKDVLDGAARIPRYANSDKSRPIDAHYCKLETNGFEKRVWNPNPTKQQHDYVAEPLPFNPTADGKCHTLTASYYKISGVPISNYGDEKARPRVAEPVRVGCMPSPDGTIKNGQGNRIYDPSGKSVTLKSEAGGSGAKTGLYAVPMRVGGFGKQAQGERIYSVDAGGCIADPANHAIYAIPVPMAVDLQVEGRKKNESGEYIRVWEAKDNQKPSALTTVESRRMVASPIPQYATPVEWDENGIPTKATSGADGKEYTVYPVEGGQITIKGKTYPIKLVDGYYIIRKLTVSECKRLQTVPEWYNFSCVSNSQAYKMLGNGWTVDVIAHLIKACLEDTHE